MIQFTELRVTPDNKCLIIDTKVEDLEYFTNVKIESILLDTQETWVPNGPSGKAIQVYTKDPDNPLRRVRLTLEKPIIDSSKNTMYFVYVIADVSNAPEAIQAPCDCSSEKIVGVAVNNYNLYNALMSNMKEITDSCGEAKNFIDTYIRLQAVETSLRTGNYPLAIKYWKKFFADGAIHINRKTCGCNGRTS